MGIQEWDNVKALMDPESLARLREARGEAFWAWLRELWSAVGKSPDEVSEAAGMSYEERRGDPRLSELRAYVAALGGTLEITAVLGDKRITLKDM